MYSTLVDIGTVFCYKRDGSLTRVMSALHMLPLFCIINIYIYKLKPFPQHSGGGHVMEVRCRCSYLHRHPFQILHSVSWEIRFGEEGSHSPCSASFSRLVRQAEDTVAEFYYASWETPAASPSHRGI